MNNNNQTKNINQMKNNNNIQNNNKIINNNHIKNNSQTTEDQLINPTMQGNIPGNNMNTQYDAIILGTGLKQCILAALLSNFPIREKGKILQLDRNNYYGSESASLNLTNLWKYFRRKNEYPKQYGKNINWNVDFIPKFIMIIGILVKILFKQKYQNIQNGNLLIDLSFINMIKVVYLIRQKEKFLWSPIQLLKL